MARRHFQVAPAGSALGLFLASDGRSSLAVVVYPKFWQRGPVSRKVVWPEETSHLAIAAGELDVIELEASPDRLQLLDRPAHRVGGFAESLVVPVRRSQSVLEAPSTKLTVNPLTALVGVESLMRRVGSGGMLSVGSGFVAPHFREPLLRPLLYRYFVDEVEAVVRRARREYEWTEESLAVVRGRPDSSSLLVNAATGWPQIRCRFQDFTRATPTLMSVCSALEFIADDGFASGKGVVTAVGEIRNDAIRLRRQLADVPSMSRSMAARTAIDLHRVGSAREWERALELAAGVLWPDAGLDIGEADPAVEISVDTSRIWELVLLAIFRSTGFDAFDGNSSAMTPFTVGRPWSGLGVQPPRPDFLVGSGDRWYVLDAKYKDLTGTPAIDDLYQMFAYSHLGVRKDQGDVERFGLVYPTRNATSMNSPAVYPRVPDGAVDLGIHRVRFPSMLECRSEWKSYLSEQSQHTQRELVRHAASVA